MRKFITVIIIIIIAFVAFSLLTGDNGTEVPDTSSPGGSIPLVEDSGTETPSLGVPAPGNEGVEETVVVSEEGSGESSDEPEGQEAAVVTYDDSGYSPRTLSVSVGTTVVFKNVGSRSMWTASAVHPTHTRYPNSGIDKCDDGGDENNFDACGSTEGGGEWSFTFNEPGSWGYHNHVRSSHTGTIVVE